MNSPIDSSKRIWTILFPLFICTWLSEMQKKNFSVKIAEENVESSVSFLVYFCDLSLFLSHSINDLEII